VKIARSGRDRRRSGRPAGDQRRPSTRRSDSPISPIRRAGSCASYGAPASQPSQVRFAGDELGPLGARPAANRAWLIDGATAISVGVEPNGVPVPDEVAAGSLEPNLGFYARAPPTAAILSPGVHATLLARAAASRKRSMAPPHAGSTSTTSGTTTPAGCTRRDGQRLAGRSRSASPAYDRGRHARRSSRCSPWMGDARAGASGSRDSRVRVHSHGCRRGERRPARVRAESSWGARAARPDPQTFSLSPPRPPLRPRPPREPGMGAPSSSHATSYPRDRITLVRPLGLPPTTSSQSPARLARI